MEGPLLTIGVLRRRQVISRLGGLSMADSTVSRSAKSERVIRVYVCSTYADMQAERTVLEGSVFPELRRRLSGYGIELAVVEPWAEWGAESGSGEGLVRRFEAIDACRPFFIATLGMRYGDAPDPAPQELSRQHPWLADHPGASVIELEIRHGVLNDVDCARRSFFYFRDPGPILRIPPEDGALYTPESWDADQHLTELKKRIRESGRPLMEDYPCRWDEDSGQIVDVREFAQRVQADLFSAIEAEFPEVREAQALATKELDPPSDLRAIQTAHRVALLWRKSPSPGNVEYLVVRKANSEPREPSDGVVMLGSGATSYTDTPPPGHFYYYGAAEE